MILAPLCEVIAAAPMINALSCFHLKQICKIIRAAAINSQSTMVRTSRFKARHVNMIFVKYGWHIHTYHTVHQIPPAIHVVFYSTGENPIENSYIGKGGVNFRKYFLFGLLRIFKNMYEIINVLAWKVDGQWFWAFFWRWD